jgi:hypothetical protein
LRGTGSKSSSAAISGSAASSAKSGMSSMLPLAGAADPWVVLFDEHGANEIHHWKGFALRSSSIAHEGVEERILTR